MYEFNKHQYSDTVTVTWDYDTMRAPWIEHDGHGIIREVESLDDLREGEEALYQENRRSKLYAYDVTGTLELATKEGWSDNPEGIRAAVQRDIDVCNDYLRSNLVWIIIHATSKKYPDISVCIGGILCDESDSYFFESVNDLAVDVLVQVEARDVEELAYYEGM